MTQSCGVRVCVCISDVPYDYAEKNLLSIMTRIMNHTLYAKKGECERNNTHKKNKKKQYTNDNDTADK